MTAFEAPESLRSNNIICVITPYPSPECRNKLEVKDYTNLRKRLALFPFVFTKGQRIFLVFWGLSLVLAILSSLRLWNIYNTKSCFNTIVILRPPPAPC